MRWQTKAKILAFVIFVLIPVIIGAGKVWDLALAARAREVAATIQTVAAPSVQAPQGAESVTEEPLQLLAGISMEDFLCMLKLAHGEAGGESRDGQAGVVFVALNRKNVRPHEFGKTLCEVAYKLIPRKYKRPGKHKRPGKQFDGAYTSVYDFRQLPPVAQVVLDVLGGKLKAEGDMQNALYFCNPKASACLWQLRNTIPVEDHIPAGHHIFAKEKPPLITVASVKR